MSLNKESLPEEVELERLCAELENKQNILADLELELATMRARLIQFEKLYMEKVGRLYVELDQLTAKLYWQRYERQRDDIKAFQAAQEAEQKAKATRNEYERHKDSLEPIRDIEVEPSAEIRTLYRKLAKRYHPDSSLDPNEKAQRTEIMARINAAYAQGNLQALQQIERELKSSPEAVLGGGVGAELIRTIRKIAQIQKRIIAVQEEISSLNSSQLFQLAEQYEENMGKGHNLLDALAQDLERRIQGIRSQLSAQHSTS